MLSPCHKKMPLDPNAITVTAPPHSPEDIDPFLYPASPALEEGYLTVSQRHSLWYATYGNPKGIPLVFLHGGPGAGCHDFVAKLFDPETYYLILLDQRGAGRSRPWGVLEENTTQNLICDLEKLRAHLALSKWALTGGSWGSTLALAYGQAHPERCLGFLLRGVYLGDRAALDHFWYGTRTLFPEAWEKLSCFIPENERSDLVRAYHKRTNGQNSADQKDAIAALMNFDLTLSFFHITPFEVEKILTKEKNMVDFVARAFMHYAANDFFLSEGQLLENIGVISHLPCFIVHSRYDALCRVAGAYDLFARWPGAHLTIVSEAGHASMEPETVKAMISAGNDLKNCLLERVPLYKKAL
ncbi:MAG: prolyl aminopeptidase [Alphaproteobacteria bacterium]